MELPPIAARYDHKLRFGAYVVGRLAQRGLDAQAARATQVTDALQQACHAIDGAARAVQEAVARRDHWVEAYEDQVAEIIKLIDDTPALAAVKRSILQNKPNYYSEVPLAELEKRGGELGGRVDKFIPPAFKDLKARLTRALRECVAGFTGAATQVTTARTALTAALAAREQATRDWDEAMRGLYHEVEKIAGAAAVERIYPALRKVETLEGDDKVGKLGAAKGGINLQKLAQMQR